MLRTLQAVLCDAERPMLGTTRLPASGCQLLRKTATDDEANAQLIHVEDRYGLSYRKDSRHGLVSAPSSCVLLCGGGSVQLSEILRELPGQQPAGAPTASHEDAT